MRKAVLYLKDILAALEAFTAGSDVESLQKDYKTLSALWSCAENRNLTEFSSGYIVNTKY